MNTSSSEEDTDTESEGLTPSEISLLSLYCVVLVVGVVANAGLALTVCSQQSSRGGSGSGMGTGTRVRSQSPLVLGLCAADLLVCCLSAPLTVYFAIIATRPWPFAAPWCKIGFFLQVLPVAVSTLSLMLVSVDRYLTVKYPRPVGRVRLQHRRRTVVAATAIAWLLAFLATCPVLAVRRVPPRFLPGIGGRCIETWSSVEWRSCYVICRLVLVHLVPGGTVLACHLAVRAKLTALSLTARAAHGELPLPVPLLRRPAHVIIVAGIANNADGKVMTYQPDEEGSSDSGIGTAAKLSKYHSGSKKRRRAANRARRATKTEHEIREENRRLRPQYQYQYQYQVSSPMRAIQSKQNSQSKGKGMDMGIGTGTVTGTGTGSTLQSRRRLANALVSAAAVFVGCWLPHVVCTVCAELCTLPSSQLAQLKQMMQFSLLLGHAHSAINPVVYWALNHQSLHSSCMPLLDHLRLPATYRNASSTNEAALGPFHPRFTRPNANAGYAHAHIPMVRRQSSCYLY